VAADIVVCIDYDDRGAGIRGLDRGGKADSSGPDDDDIRSKVPLPWELARGWLGATRNRGLCLGRQRWYERGTCYDGCSCTDDLDEFMAADLVLLVHGSVLSLLISGSPILMILSTEPALNRLPASRSRTGIPVLSDKRFTLYSFRQVVNKNSMKYIE
jgi:hypothetical protein